MAKKQLSLHLTEQAREMLEDLTMGYQSNSSVAENLIRQAHARTFPKTTATVNDITLGEP